MATICLHPDSKEIQVKDGQTVLEASLDAGVQHAHACGGKALCSTCRVLVKDGAENLSKPDAKELALTKKLNFGPKIRLACQAEVHGDVTLQRPVLDEIDHHIVAEQLKESTSGIQPNGQQVPLAILFADVVSYTPFAESLPAYDIIHVLNRYFYLMGEEITASSGKIIDYYGDGLLAVFGLKSATEGANQAHKAAMGMFKALNKINPYLETMFNRSFQIRIGIHYGEVVVGTVGVGELKKFSVIGDAVNLASRIEGLNKELGTNLLVTDAFLNALSDQVAPLESFERSLKGKSGKYKVHALRHP